jgi:hypothetical protein
MATKLPPPNAFTPSLRDVVACNDKIDISLNSS